MRGPDISREPVLLGAVRTVHGRYGGSLRDVRMIDLAARAGVAALSRAGIDVEDVNEVVVANCRQAGNGPNPGRQIALRIGLPVATPAHTLNMACASGLKAIDVAAQQVRSGEADVVLVVAAESMSTMPFLAPYTLRWSGNRRGNITLADGWTDGGNDPISGLNMGETAEKVAAAYGIDRQRQDAWAAESHHRVTRAWASGRFHQEALPVEHASGVLVEDETYRRDTSAGALAALSPAFDGEGTVTAGNASQMADGAAAVVVAAPSVLNGTSAGPVGRLTAFTAVGVEPSLMGIGPTRAIPDILARTGLESTQVDLFEINEAFAAQIVQNVEMLRLDPQKVNVNGGGIALGHPTGQSGCRIVVSLLHELEAQDLRLGVASLCVGGGMGVAAVIERVGV